MRPIFLQPVALPIASTMEVSTDWRAIMRPISLLPVALPIGSTMHNSPDWRAAGAKIFEKEGADIGFLIGNCVSFASFTQ